jgi:hypothetical protein
MSLKRLNREIMKLFPDKMMELSLPYQLAQFESKNSNNYIADFTIVRDNTLILNFSIQSCYPFKPPIIAVPHKFMDKRYDRWSADLTTRITRMSNEGLIPNLFLAWAFSVIETPCLAAGWLHIPVELPMRCLCCESITCSGNWAPSLTIADILIEYLSRKRFELYCSPLWQKRILPIFNNDRWNLPDDLILCIIQHMNIPDRFKIY